MVWESNLKNNNISRHVEITKFKFVTINKFYWYIRATYICLCIDYGFLSSTATKLFRDYMAHSS